MKTNKRILVVGGGVQHAWAARILKEYGYDVVLADNTMNPPAKGVADKHIQENAYLPEVLESIVKRENIDIIFNICYDLATPSVAYVSEKLGLPAPYSYSQSLMYVDKMLMKETFIKYGIPTAKYHIVSSTLNCKHDLKYPIVVKPVDSSGSRGVAKASSDNECWSLIESARKQSRSGKVLLEEYIAGNEYQVDCIVKNGQVHIVLAKQKLKFLKEEVISPSGSLIIPDEENKLYNQELFLAETLVRAFNIRNGVFFYQCIEREGVLYMIEIGVRIGGGLSYKMIRDIKGVDFVNVATDAYLDLSLTFDIRKNTKYFLSNAVFVTKPAIVKFVSGLEELYTNGNIKNWDVYHTGDFKVDGLITNKNRLALFLLDAENLKQLREKFISVVDHIHVISQTGENCFDTSIYYSLIDRIYK